MVQLAYEIIHKSEEEKKGGDGEGNAKEIN